MYPCISPQGIGVEDSHFDYAGLSARDVARTVYFGEIFPQIVGQAAPRAPEFVARVLEEAGVARGAAQVEVDYDRINALCRSVGVPARVIPCVQDQLMTTRFWGEQRARPMSVEQGIAMLGKHPRAGDSSSDSD